MDVSLPRNQAAMSAGEQMTRAHRYAIPREVLLKLPVPLSERPHIEHPTAVDLTASILAANPWLNEPGACFRHPDRGGRLRGALSAGRPPLARQGRGRARPRMPPPATHVSPPRNKANVEVSVWVSPSRLQ